MLKYIIKIKKYVIFQIVLDLFGVICLAIAPLLQEWLFDYGLNTSLVIIVGIILAYIGLLVLYAFSQFFCILFAFKGGILFEINLKKDFFLNVFHMKNSEFYKKTIGEYISIQGNDITAIEQDYLEPFISLIRSINMLLVYGCVLFIALDWRIALVIILSSLTAILIPRLMGRSLNNARKNYQNQMGTYVTTITDLLEGFHLINTNTIINIINRHDETLKTTANKRYIYGRKKALFLEAVN